MLAELGTELGLPGLAPDASGRLSLTIGEVPLTLLYTEQPVDLLWIFCGLGELDGLDEDAMAFLLRATGRLWPTSGMTLGIGEDGKQLLGRLQIPVSALESGVLKEALTLAVEASQPLRSALAARDFSDAETPEQQPSRPFPGTGSGFIQP
jgi:hypothetical protein